MVFPILTTKFYIPALRPTVVDRPHLLQRMNAGLSGRLTLVSAPAGSGKSTMVSQWITQTHCPAAWLSLDEGESAPSRFFVYLLGAIQTVEKGLGDGLSALLDTPQPPPLESILTALLNQLAALPQEMILVLDDYHAVDSQAVDSALVFLIEHLPPQVHLVIITREDPQIPLPRLRARGQLTEVRAADLRFSPAETAAFLNRMMGLDLTDAEVAALESRTEGWAAGLQLAALSLQGQKKQAEFVRAFAGDNRYIVDYLVDEVLDQQPPSVRGFLLQTAILRRLTGPLCDAVTGGTGGAEMLESLERANLFVVPLDNSRRWYRYHHLFGEVLRAHLYKAQPEGVAALHRRASTWYWENDLPEEAIHHALAAPDYEQAARLLELLWPTMERSRQSARWLGWIQTVPQEIVQARPVLCAGYGWALLDQGELEASRGWLDKADRWLKQIDGSLSDPVPVPAGAVVVDAAQYGTLPAVIATARAYVALAFGDRSATVSHAQRALDLLPPDNHLLRGSPAALLGLAFWASGRLEEAEGALTEALGSFQKAGNILFAITGVFGLADIRLSLGRRRAALAVYENALQMAQDGTQPVVWGTADVHTGLGEFYCEQNELERAESYLQRSKELGESANFPRWRFRWSLAQARLKAAQGDLESALSLLDEAEQHFVRGPVPDVRPIPARKARLWLAQGYLSPARQWAAAEALAADDDLAFLQEYGHITLARLLLMEYRQEGRARSIEKALNLLHRLLLAAQAGSRQASVVEISLLLALAHAAQSDSPAALPHLQRALALAEPEGYVRLFLDEGPPLARLLAETPVRKLAPDYTGRLLAAFDSPLAIPTEQTASTSVPAPAPSSRLIEPLSERELEVLALIAQGFSNREICNRLYLALSTVKGHNRNIFGKLQVQRRTEAVAKARELGLL